MASAGHTSALISRSPSKYVSGDEVQVLWDSWAEATLRPRSGPACCLGSASRARPSPWPPRCRPECVPTVPRHTTARPGQNARGPSAHSAVVLGLCVQGSACPASPQVLAPSVARRRVFDSPINVHGGPLAPKQQNPKTSPGTRAGFTGFLCGSYGPGLGLRGLSRCPSGCVEQSAVFCRCFSGAESH